MLSPQWAFWTCTHEGVCVFQTFIWVCGVCVCTLWPGRNITWVSGSCLTFWMKKSRAGGVRKGQSHSGNLGLFSQTTGRDASPTPSLCTFLFPICLSLFLAPYFHPLFYDSFSVFFSSFNNIFCFLMQPWPEAVMSVVFFLCLIMWTQCLRNISRMNYLDFVDKGQRWRSLWFIEPAFVIRSKVSFAWDHKTFPVVT